LGPDGQVITAAAVPYLEAVAVWAWGKFGEDGKNRVLDMLSRAWRITGMDSTRFARRISRNEQTRLLTATAIKGASSTAWPPRVTAIGDLLAKGLIADDEAEIDLAALGLTAMAEMERPHVSLLDLLVNYVPDITMADSRAMPYAGYRYSDDGFWYLGNRKWTEHQIIAVRPKLTAALGGLMGTLVRHGLAMENDEAAEALDAALRGFEQNLVSNFSTITTTLLPIRRRPEVMVCVNDEIDHATAVHRRILATNGIGAARPLELVPEVLTDLN